MIKKFIKNIFIVAIMYIFMLPNYAMAINNSDYKIWTNSYEKEVIPTKEWKIKFNKEIEKTSEFQNEIFITEQNSNVKIPVDLELSKDERTVIVKHKNPFEYGKQYFLYVNSDIKSKENNTKLKNGVKMSFKIKNQPQEVQSTDYMNGNIANGGNVVQNGKYIYYSGANDNGLYKIDTNDNVKTKLFDGEAQFINIEKDWIYFVDWRNSNMDEYRSNSCIYKMKTDGSYKVKLCEGNYYSNLIVSNGWLYFLNNSEEKLYKMKVDGTSKTVVANGYITNMNIVDDYIYYIDDGIYKIKTDGSNKRKLANFKPTFMVVEGNSIYYQIESEPYFKYKICNMDLDGKNIKDICNFESVMTECFDANFFNVDSEWIYYVCKNNSELSLCKIKKDGTKFTSLTDESCHYISLTKDWIYFKNVSIVEDATDEKFWEMKKIKIRKDGTKKQIIDSCITGF